MAAGDLAHQFQMLLKPLRKALEQGNVEAGLRFTRYLFDVGGGPSQVQDRKVHFLVTAMEGASPAVKTEFTAKVLEELGPQLNEDSRARLAGRLERL
ncbi:MAG: hypothetical protein E6K18_04185 [Methanobacteriota archaeon]|nr:MAG: hypothetical protein E6K18_04185 [Euryarchaeota archaeon]